MKRALFIVGSTAIGKTNLAFKISKTFQSILISADSIQVYQGADIISGKDRSVETFLLDVILPHKSFSVREFIERISPLVEKAKKENKIPVIVGGTGFYIDALFGKIDTISIPPNKALREKLEKLNVRELQKELKKLSSERFHKMSNSDSNNKRRLIRAIEVARSTGSGQAGSNLPEAKAVFIPQEVLMIGLKTSMENLRRRIIARVEKRIKMGALNEAKNLFREYKKLSQQIKSASGYKQMFEFLSGSTSFKEAKERWIISDYQYAKRQMTWFRRNKNIHWFDISERDFEAEVLELIKRNFPSSFLYS